MFGVAWIFLSPLLMLAIFAFVFGHVFQARWPEQREGLPFWLMLYSGLIVFNLFAETVSRAPTTVRGYPSLRQKDHLPARDPAAGAARRRPGARRLQSPDPCGRPRQFGQLSQPASCCFPVLLVPVVLLGARRRLVPRRLGRVHQGHEQIVPLFVQMLLFLSPVFYPASAVPQGLTSLYNAQPARRDHRGHARRRLRPARAWSGMDRRPARRRRGGNSRPRLLPAMPVTSSPMPSDDIAISVAKPHEVLPPVRASRRPGQAVPQPRPEAFPPGIPRAERRQLRVS